MCAVALISTATFVSGQDKQDKSLNKIIEFLNSSEELANYSDSRSVEFTGEFRSLPDEIQSELNQNFPEFNFYIAKVIVLIDWPPAKYNLILIANAVSGEVKGFVWANYWMLSPSKSFQSLLEGLPAKSKDDAIAKMKTFAKLLVFANDDKKGDAIGNVKNKNRKIKVELIRGEGVLGIVEVEIDKCLRFGRLRITERDGRYFRYFV